MSNDDPVAIAEGERRLLAKLFTAVASYYVAMVLWFYLGFWLKLQFSLAGAPESSALGLRSWHALETGFIALGAMAWVAVHLLVVLARHVLGGEVGRSRRSIILSSLAGAGMCVALVLVLDFLLWEPHREFARNWGLLVALNFVLPVVATSYAAIVIFDAPFLLHRARNSSREPNVDS